MTPGTSSGTRDDAAQFQDGYRPTESGSVRRLAGIRRDTRIAPCAHSKPPDDAARKRRRYGLERNSGLERLRLTGPLQCFQKRVFGYRNHRIRAAIIVLSDRLASALQAFTPEICVLQLQRVHVAGHFLIPAQVEISVLGSMCKNKLNTEEDAWTRRRSSFPASITSAFSA
jgi:hypothetical protein